MQKRRWLSLIRLYPRSLAHREREVHDFWRLAIGDAKARGLFAVAVVLTELIADIVRCRLSPSTHQLTGPSTHQPTNSGDHWLMSWLADIRFAFRSLWRRPGLTTTSTVSLAVGLGGTLAIYAVASSVLVRPLPFAAPDRLVSVETMVQRASLEPRGWSVQDFLDHRAQTGDVFESLAAWDSITMTLRADGQGHPTPMELVTGDYFSLLGATPVLGSVFPDRAAVDPVPPLVISKQLWSSRFNSDPAVIGRTIDADEQFFTIIGVLADPFHGVTGTAEAWVPFGQHEALVGESLWNNRGNRWHSALGKLKAGVTVEQADAAVAAVAGRLAAAYPRSNQTYTARTRQLRDALYGDARPQLLILLAAVAVVLFMTCVNVANLLVARLSAREYEFAVRASLGATRGRLVSLAAADGFVLSVFGAVAGAPIAWWIVQVIGELNPANLPTFAAPTIDLDVVLAGIVATVIAAAFVTIASLAAFGRNRTGHLSVRSATDSAPTVRLRQALTTLQVGCAVGLLTTAVLLGLSFRNVTRVEPGYRTAQTLVASLDLPPSRYDAPRRLSTAFELHAKLRVLPGVRAAALSSDAMLGGGSSASFFVADAPHLEPEAQQGRVYVHQVTEDFFEAAGIPLLEGGTLPTFDGRPMGSDVAEMPVVVSRQLAQLFWPSRSAIGERVKLGRIGSTSPWMRIVGVAGDTKFRGLPDNPTQDPDLYLPFAVRPITGFSAVMHTAVDPLSLTAAVQHSLASVDATVPLTRSYDLAAHAVLATAPQRFLSQLSSVFALVALLLAMVGTYGVVAYQVLLSQRAIGIRLALGAVPRQIFLGVMGNTGRVLGVGLVLGGVLATWATRRVAEQLYLVGDVGTTVVFGVSVLVSAVALAAAWLPARRAMAVNPVCILRAEQ